MNTLNLATHLLVTRFAFDAAARPMERKVLAARLAGAVNALHALGFGMTPFMVESEIDAAIQSQTTRAGARPGYEPVRNTSRKAWDEQAARDLAARLDAILR